jgi:predicted RND superfamily exporter protein
MSYLLSFGKVTHEMTAADTQRRLTSSPAKHMLKSFYFYKKTMKKPAQGALQAISSATAPLITVAVAFLGFWAYGSNTQQIAWTQSGHIIVGVVVSAITLLVAIPVVITHGGEDRLASAIRLAQILYSIGAILLIGSISYALFQF